MDKEIIDSIYHLFRSRMVTTIIALMLIIVVIIVIIGVVKFRIVEPILYRVFLIIGVTIGSIVMLTQEFFSIMPFYKDYTEQSYVVLENAEVTISESYSINYGLDYICDVTVISDGNYYELTMETDYSLSTPQTYTGTVVYLKHSNYVTWYDFD